jgi:hypothetical protein
MCDSLWPTIMIIICQSFWHNGIKYYASKSFLNRTYCCQFHREDEYTMSLTMSSFQTHLSTWKNPELVWKCCTKWIFSSFGVAVPNDKLKHHSITPTERSLVPWRAKRTNPATHARCFTNPSRHARKRILVYTSARSSPRVSKHLLPFLGNWKYYTFRANDLRQWANKSNQTNQSNGDELRSWISGFVRYFGVGEAKQHHET